MTKILTDNLSGAALDWAVAAAEGMVLDKMAPGAGSIWFKTGIWTQPGPGGAQQPYCLHSEYLDWCRKCDGGVLGPYTRVWQPTENWSQGGPIIEREGILLRAIRKPGHSMDGQWLAMYDGTNTGTMIQWVKRTDWPRRYLQGPTPLIAAMRCYVASKLGDVVDIPDELCHVQ